MSSPGAVHLHERNTDENEMDYESSNNHEDSGEGMVCFMCLIRSHTLFLYNYEGIVYG